MIAALNFPLLLPLSCPCMECTMERWQWVRAWGQVWGWGSGTVPPGCPRSSLPASVPSCLWDAGAAQGRAGKVLVGEWEMVRFVVSRI